NQNWHPGWRASAGTVVSDSGLLAVDLPPGEQDLTLRFAPRSAFAGAGVSIAALVALGLLARGAARGPFPFRRRAAPRTAALVLLPWLTALGFAAAWTEPRYPAPALHNADGSPALVDAPPPNAPPLGARFALPVVLDAAGVHGPDSVENVAIDLYLRRI